MPTNKTRFIARAAIIAAAYAILTLSLAPIAYGSLQLRLAEALTVLAYFSPAAVCGLTVGCAVANFWSPFGITDVVFGALATGIAAVLTYFMPKKGLWKFLAPPALRTRQRSRHRRCDRGLRQRRRFFLAGLRRERAGRGSAPVSRMLCGGPAPASVSGQQRAGPPPAVTIRRTYAAIT